ncbi:MAG: hypothetical protein QOE70_6160 [Chthoniobacter sp.]|nr:hypothetical protein [Chthoniobacter sp.]
MNAARGLLRAASIGRWMLSVGCFSGGQKPVGCLYLLRSPLLEMKMNSERREITHPTGPLGAAGATGFLEAYLPAFLAAQRAFKAATILARPSGLSFRVFFLGLEAGPLAATVAVPFDFAHLARCAAAIFSRASADIVRLPRLRMGDAAAAALGTDGAEERSPTIRPSSASSCWICSAMARARLSWSMLGVGMSVELPKKFESRQ